MPERSEGQYPARRLGISEVVVGQGEEEKYSIVRDTIQIELRYFACE